MRAELDVQKIPYVLPPTDSDYQMITRSNVLAAAMAPMRALHLIETESSDRSRVERTSA